MEEDGRCVSFLGLLTKHHRLSGLNNKHLFLTVLEAGKSRIEAPVGSVSGEDPNASSQTAVFSLGPHMAQDTRPLSRISFVRAPIPLMRALRS